MKTSASSGIVTPRIALAFALCSFGIFLGMFSVAATPLAETARAHTRLPNDSATVLSPAAQSAWEIVNSPNTSAADSNRLWSVTCPTASDCWAVGDHYPGNAVTTAQTLIEHWDGSSWAMVSSPNTGTYNTLYGVTCVSSSDCWAVGFYNATQWQTLVQHWNGTAWTVVSSPSTSPSQTNILMGVTCASAADCWAVGYATNGNGYDPLIVHWDGNLWAIVPSPSTGVGQSTKLRSVACASASECWAVGESYVGSDATARTLIQRWNGSAWTIVTSPNTLREQNFLTGVTCVAASDCWAVGYSNSLTNGGHETLVEHWDGTSWAIVSSPNASGENWLTGVTCASTSNCWAVGYIVSGTYQTFITGWDGSSWEIVTSPNSSSTQLNLLYGVACLPTSECWAVGNYSTGSAWQTLTVRSPAPVPPLPTGAVSRKIHGAVEVFDIDLPLTSNPGIECRTGGNNDYQVIVTFPSAVTFNSAAVTSGTGTVASTTGSGTTALTVNLTGVTNAQTITLTLSGVNDGTNTGDIGVRMSVLIGDTNADRFVNSADISQTKSKSGQAVDSSNFRQDVTTDGFLNSADISLVKSRSGTALP